MDKKGPGAIRAERTQPGTRWLLWKKGEGKQWLMPADPHIVRRIEESHVYMRPVANNAPQEFGIAAVATPHAMIPEDTEIA